MSLETTLIESTTQVVEADTQITPLDNLSLALVGGGETPAAI